MYCSRKSKISRGLGTSTNSCSTASASSSSRISLHSPMHSSQMYTAGPAMSLRTCFCVLPQNVHLSRSPLSAGRAIEVPSPVLSRVARGPDAGSATRRLSPPSWAGLSDRLDHCCALAGLQHLVHDAVFLRLRRREEGVALDVAAHLLRRLTGVECQRVLEPLAHPQNLFRVDLDVRCL